MSFLKGAIVAAAFAVATITPAAAQMANGSAMMMMSGGQTKMGKMQGTKMPRGAKEVKGDMIFFMMNGKMYMAPASRASNEMFIF